jgi:hypothetical protein
VRVLLWFCLLCVSRPPLLLCLLKINCVKRERLQIVEISHNGKSLWQEREPWHSSWSLDHLRGLSATLVHWDATTCCRRAFYAWPNHELKLLCHLSKLRKLYVTAILLFLALHFTYNIALILILTLWEQLSEEVLSSHPLHSDLVFYLTNSILDQVCFVKLFLKDHLFTPLYVLSLRIRGGRTHRGQGKAHKTRQFLLWFGQALDACLHPCCGVSSQSPLILRDPCSLNYPI